MIFTNILVPTDGSEFTKGAIEKAIELASCTKSKVTALYVLDQTIFVNMPLDSAVANVYNLLEEEGNNAVHFVKEMGAKKDVDVEIKVVEGSPVKTILDMSADYDLIVMGTLGRTGMSKILMGSVAEKVVRSSACPVLVVKSNKEENQ